MTRTLILSGAILAIAMTSPVTADELMEQVRAIGGTYGICASVAEATGDAKVRAQCERTAIIALRALGVCVDGDHIPPVGVPPPMRVCGR